jgi:hypothetical protein
MDRTAGIQDPQRILDILCNLIRIVQAIEKKDIECELIGGLELIRCLISSSHDNERSLVDIILQIL